MHWEYHLSKATASQTIRNSLLAIHYLVTERNDYIDRNLTTLESLNLSFLNASLAWYRVGSDLFIAMRKMCLDGVFCFQKHYGHQNPDDGNKGDDDGEGDRLLVIISMKTKLITIQMKNSKAKGLNRGARRSLR